MIVLSIVGSHAGEEVHEIFKRKNIEIAQAGFSLWLYKSYRAKPETLQRTKPLEVYFLESKGARPTTEQQQAIEFSEDGVLWKPIPKGIRVTGKLPATALVLKSFCIQKKNIDLWDYSFNGPIQFALGASTVLAEEKPAEGMKDHLRTVVATATFKKPFCVYVR